MQIDHAHEDDVGPATDIRGNEADDDTDGQRHHGGEDAHAQTDAQAVKDRRQHVAALIVGAEQEGPTRTTLATGREFAVHDVELREVVRVLRRDHWRADRDGEGQQQHDQRGDRDAAARVAGGEFAQR